MPVSYIICTQSILTLLCHNLILVFVQFGKSPVPELCWAFYSCIYSLLMSSLLVEVCPIETIITNSTNLSMKVLASSTLWSSVTCWKFLQGESCKLKKNYIRNKLFSTLWQPQYPGSFEKNSSSRFRTFIFTNCRH